MEPVATRGGTGHVLAGRRRAWFGLLCLWLLSGAWLASLAQAAPIPEGTALRYACTQAHYMGPPQFRCPLPYDPRYASTFLAGFSRFTPENEFKPDALEPAEGEFAFTLADEIARFARSEHRTIRGHFLVGWAQEPFWLRYPLLPWNRTTLTAVLNNYIATVVHHFAVSFPGVVSEWDVVNEPLAPDGSLTPDVWERMLGPGYIRLALEDAHAAAPGVRLVLNDEGIESGPKAAAMLALAQHLKALGAPLGAVGFESHVTVATAPSLDALVSLWRRYAAIGVDVEVTELDVNNDHGVDDPSAKAAVFKRYAQACRLAGNCVGFTVWGVADPYSWLGMSSDALLYDSSFTPIAVVPEISALLAGTAPTTSPPPPPHAARPPRGATRPPRTGAPHHRRRHPHHTTGQGASRGREGRDGHSRDQAARRGGRGCVASHSSRVGSRPAPRADMTHALWAWRRRVWSPSGNRSMCSDRAGNRPPHNGQV